jgi:hypothetical protein
MWLMAKLLPANDLLAILFQGQKKPLSVTVKAHEKARRRKQNCGSEAHLVSFPD